MNNKQKSVLVDFVKAIDPNLKVEFQPDTFECDIDNEIVYIAEQYDKDTDTMFEDFVVETWGKKYDTLLLSILHEIGHIFTYDLDLEEDRAIKYGLLSVVFEDTNKTLEDIRKYNFDYFKIPMEFNATKWGVDFYDNNLEFCEKISKIFKKSIDNN